MARSADLRPLPSAFSVSAFQRLPYQFQRFALPAGFNHQDTKTPSSSSPPRTGRRIKGEVSNWKFLGDLVVFGLSNLPDRFVGDAQCGIGWKRVLATDKHG